MWNKPSEVRPEIEVGDRVLGVVMARRTDHGQLRPSLILLELTERGWSNEDGYDLGDCLFWAHEWRVARVPVDHEAHEVAKRGLCRICDMPRPECVCDIT